MTARPTGNDEELARARVELTLALRIAARHDLHEGIDNHFSIALDAERFLVNSYGKHWSEICPGDILEVDQDGTVLSGSGHWDIAAFTIHRAAHAARPDARAVFHTHMTQATAVANTAESLDTRLTQSAMYFTAGCPPWTSTDSRRPRRKGVGSSGRSPVPRVPS